MIFIPQFPFPLLHEIPGCSSFLTSAVCNALRLLQCNNSHRSYLTLNLHPWSPPWPQPPITAVATLHHSPAKTTSIFALACPLGWAKWNGDSLAASQQYICPTRPAKWYARCHRPTAWLQVPAAWWATWLLLVASGGAAWLPLPLSSCGAEQVASRTICCTDFVLVSLSDASWLLSGRGLGLVRSLFQSLVVFLPGVGKKFSF